MASLFIFLKKINFHISTDQLALSDGQSIIELMKEMDSVLAVMEFEKPDLKEEIYDLIRTRGKARKNKDWGRADRIRLQLSEMGIDLIDTPSGPMWRIR